MNKEKEEAEMGRTLNEIIGELPEAEQADIRARADHKVEEMLREAGNLGAIRKALGKTQVNVAEKLGVKQNAISQLEKRQDIYLSTFKKFLRTLGMELEMVLVAKNGDRYALTNFDPSKGVDHLFAESGGSAGADARRAPRRRTVQKAVAATKQAPGKPATASTTPAKKKATARRVR
ncbi:helix-turn-helix domain-containing protein [Trinickia sp.]|uniref:helix-turn-helix domain-containing protein n=1 Tax=Trinickia sp. TaxID=2571163 RepID=UPI003F7FA1A4